MKLGTFVRPNDLSRLDEAFAPLREMGFTSCQLAYKPEVFRPEDADLIRRAAERHGVEISAHFIGFRDAFSEWDLRYGFLCQGLTPPTYRQARLEYLLSGIPFVRRLGTDDLIVHAGFVPNNPFDPEYLGLLAALRCLAIQARAQGVNVLLETGAESPVTLLRLIEEIGTGNVYVNLDTGNCIMYGYSNPVDALHTIGKYVRNVHMKDGLPPTTPYAFGPEKPLGEGCVDFDRFMKGLRALGYDRFLTIEREISGPQQRVDIERAKEYIERLLAQA